MDQNLIKAGDFVIVQRQGYTKLHKMKQRGTIMLGKDVIELDDVLGHKHYETFRMVLKPNSRRLYALEEVAQLTTTKQLNVEQSGRDNRNIIDDGSSQTLTKDQIEDLRDRAMSSSHIVEKLIANSKTFKSKTEYSQEKYMKKKEKKYFEYIQIRKPTIRLLAQMFFRQDPAKTLGIRMDDLSQILAYANVQSDGNFLLYDSGTSGLVTAAIVNAIGANTKGRLIHAHPGNECQKNAFIAMQFPQEQAERCIHVNLYSVLRCYYQNKESYIINESQSTGEPDCQLETLKQTNEDLRKTNADLQQTNECLQKTKANLERTIEQLQKTHSDQHKTSKNASTSDESQQTNENLDDINDSKDETNRASRKRKLHDTDLGEQPAKKPCWQIENEKACRILEEKVDSIIIIAKEHPINIVKELVAFLRPGRAVVVFSLVKEPLQDLYFYLKSRTDFIAVKLSNNFMRNYQILPERTHPEVAMNFGGYILSGFKLNL